MPCGAPSGDVLYIVVDVLYVVDCCVSIAVVVYIVVFVLRRRRLYCSR